MSPHWGRPAGPDTAGVATRRDAWRRLYRQVRGKVDISDRRHMDVIDTVHRAIAEALMRVTICENPLYIPPRMAGELVRMRREVIFRRMERRGCIPPNSD